ncbi:LGFP repeat-containing protein [Gordonia iterans]
MRKFANRKTAAVVAGLAATTLVAAGCSDSEDEPAATNSVVASATESGAADGADHDHAHDVELKTADGQTVTLTGPIAAKYSAATEDQKEDLGAPLSGADASGTSDSGVVFQQFAGGVITAKNGDDGTPAYITWGKIRDAWNVKRNAEGEPDPAGKGGSDGPLGAATSDETETGDVKKSTFEHGEITYDEDSDKVVVTVKGKVVATE